MEGFTRDAEGPPKWEERSSSEVDINQPLRGVFWCWIDRLEVERPVPGRCGGASLLLNQLTEDGSPYRRRQEKY